MVGESGCEAACLLRGEEGGKGLRGGKVVGGVGGVARLWGVLLSINCWGEFLAVS